MPINQPDSALARADGYITEVRAILRQTLSDLQPASPDSEHTVSNLLDAVQRLDLARGALNFAGNSQQKLIDGLRAALTTEGHTLMSKVVEQGFAAIEHAEGPGID